MHAAIRGALKERQRRVSLAVRGRFDSPPTMNIGLMIGGCLCDLAGILALLYSIDLFHGPGAFAAGPKVIAAASLGLVFFIVGAMCLRAAVREMKENRGQTPDGNA